MTLANKGYVLLIWCKEPMDDLTDGINFYLLPVQALTAKDEVILAEADGHRINEYDLTKLQEEAVGKISQAICPDASACPDKDWAGKWVPYGVSRVSGNIANVVVTGFVI